MTITTLPGITAKTITTARITTRVLQSGPVNGIAVLFLHGNLSSATWWEETMLTLPPTYQAIAPDQRGFGEADTTKKIDATGGMGDWVDDAIALLDHLNLEKAHMVGNSLGGSVIWPMLINHPHRFLSATLVAPGSPYGFGGTKNVTGTPCFPDYAGSGGGLANPTFVKLVTEGDRTLDNQFSPRAALRNLVYKPPFIPNREEEFLTAALSIHIGPQDWPGDSTLSPNWPYVAPGQWGPANALSPKYAADIKQLYTITSKVPILWIRGSHDLTVSDKAAADMGYLGVLGLIPNWPGSDTFPPQPMLAQTRAVLDTYAASGGHYQEIVIANTGHVPFIEQLDIFNKHFHQHLARST